jgi:hypothetical protein
MNENHFTHLSDEQFSDCALGMEPVGDAAAHLSACSECTEELARFGASMTEFSAAALGWSESRSPMSLRQLGLKASSPHPRFAIASWALAAGFLLAVGVSTVTHREHRGAADGGSAAVASPVGEVADCSEAEIAQDNKLLQDVNMAIGSGEPSPVSQYRLSQTDVAPSRQHMGAGIQ